MDNSPLSTPHKPHYIPEFYHHQAWFMTPQNPQQDHPMSQNASFTFNLNQNNNYSNDIDEVAPNPTSSSTIQEERHHHHEDGEEEEEELNDTKMKEPMFEKPLTPSDVGKLNRLVIPKQHAEKYFPLGGGDSAGSGGEKGLLLSFEDESGKFWRFRYSYWNSSQSYVLTKGWSRYVKEKRLDAGDVVLFERHRRDADRLFIGWRRRPPPAAQDSTAAQGSGAETTAAGWTRMFYSAHPSSSYPTHPHYHHHHHHHPAAPYQPDCVHAGSPAQHQTTSANGNSKILRLFGVNLECQPDESEPSTPDGSSMSSQGPAHHQFYPPAYYSDHMDFTFSRDVKPMRNRRG